MGRACTLSSIWHTEGRCCTAAKARILLLFKTRITYYYAPHDLEKREKPDSVSRTSAYQQFGNFDTSAYMDMEKLRTNSQSSFTDLSVPSKWLPGSQEKEKYNKNGDVLCMRIIWINGRVRQLSTRTHMQCTFWTCPQCFLFFPSTRRRRIVFVPFIAVFTRIEEEVESIYMWSIVCYHMFSLYWYWFIWGDHNRGKDTEIQQRELQKYVQRNLFIFFSLSKLFIQAPA